MPVALLVMMKKFDLHLRHIDTRRTFALAAFAADTKIQRILDSVGRKRLMSKLPADRQAQRIRPTTRHMLLVAGRAVARAHGARVEFPAGTVVVAHLDGASQTTGVFPVECRFNFLSFVIRLVPEQRTVILLGRVHDLAGIHQSLRIKQRFDFAQCRRQTRPKKRRNPFGAHQTVAVFARIGTLVFAHQLRCFLGNRAHLYGTIGFHIEDRPHMQAADRGMCIPGAFGAVFLKYLGQASRVFSKVRQRHRAVFDKTNRFAVALHRHHDIEAGLAHFPNRLLQIGIGDFHHTARKSQVSHELHQLLQFGDLCRVILAGEFNEQHTIGLTLQKRVNRFLVNGNAARQIEHGAVDQLNCGRCQFHDMLCRVHAIVKTREVANAEGLVLW